jgi:hypothetical protein
LGIPFAGGYALRGLFDSGGRKPSSTRKKKPATQSADT